MIFLSSAVISLAFGRCFGRKAVMCESEGRDAPA